MRTMFRVWRAGRTGGQFYGEYRTWPQTERAIRQLIRQGEGGSWCRLSPGRAAVWGWFQPYTADLEASVVTERELAAPPYRGRGRRGVRVRRGGGPPPPTPSPQAAAD